MSSLYLFGHDGYFSWQIDGLTAEFNTDNYIAAGLTINQFTSTTGVASISGIISTVYATSDRSGIYYTPLTEVPYDSGKYTFWSWCLAKNGLYYAAGSNTVTVTDTVVIPPVTPTRPDDWYWYSDIRSGIEIKLYAADWELFCNRINEFRAYKGLSAYNFTPVYPGLPISADICQEAWFAISGISDLALMPEYPSRGQPIYASFFNNLAYALNAVY